ncbi:hypothetical protein LguiA_004039 [Lonicera macranthoides]
MSVSAIFGSRVTLLPRTSFPSSGRVTSGGAPTKVGLVLECSSRPQKKATAHHRKTRPRKSQRWDIKRGPAVYPPLPALPPEWTLVTDDGGDTDAADGGAPPPVVEVVE